MELSNILNGCFEGVTGLAQTRPSPLSPWYQLHISYIKLTLHFFDLSWDILINKLWSSFNFWLISPFQSCLVSLYITYCLAALWKMDLFGWVLWIACWSQLLVLGVLTPFLGPALGTRSPRRRPVISLLEQDRGRVIRLKLQEWTFIHSLNVYWVRSRLSTNFVWFPWLVPLSLLWAFLLSNSLKF